MKVTLTLKDAGPNLAAVAERAKSPDLMRLLGAQLVSIARGNFSDSKNRPAVWPARKSGGAHPLLKKSGDLWRGIFMSGAVSGKVTVGSPAKYAAIHQFGGKTKPHEITAAPGKVLAFTGTYKFFGIASAARKTFAKKVKHPGSVIPPRPYFPIKPGTSQLTDYAERALQWTAGVYLKNGKA
jgi:phage gpG-like protein